MALGWCRVEGPRDPAARRGRRLERYSKGVMSQGDGESVILPLLNGAEEHIYEPGARPPVHEPTYPAPMGSVEDARAELARVAREIVDIVLAYKPPPSMPKPETEAEKA